MTVSGSDPFHPFHPTSTRSRRRRSARVLPCRLRLESLETRDLPSGTPAADQLRQAYGQIPLSFEANRGQVDASVKYLAHGQGYSLFLTGADAVLSLSRPADPTGGGRSGNSSHGAAAATVDSTLNIRLIGASDAPHVAGVDQLAGVSNYFIGANPRQWHVNVPTYAQVAYQDVYPGIDLVYYGNQQQLEYDFNLAPGADPNAIRLAFDGAQDVSLDQAGNLVVQLAGGTVVEHAPILYQWGPNGKEPVAGRYVLEGNHQAGFAVGAYDRSRELVIDPTLAYSTYLGGTLSDAGQGIAVDSAGNAYVTGSTSSTDFPTTTGAFQTSTPGGRSAFITKLNPSGTALVYSTYIGGSLLDSGAAIAVDSAGNASITGSATSPDFPTTAGAFQTALRGSQNAFVTKLNASGTSLVYSSYLGGSNSDEATAIALDNSGNAYITGDTISTNFPTTVGAFQTASQSMSQPTGFVTKLNANGTGLVYSTYLGGSNSDKGQGIAVDGSGDAYVTGNANSADFPTTVGAFQTTPPGPSSAFVTKLNAGGTGLIYSTYLGGNRTDVGAAITLDASGNAIVVGTASSFNFPTTPGAVQQSPRGLFNAFVTKLNVNGTSLGFSTYLGGSGEDHATGVAVDDLGNTYVTGYTESSDFPITSTALQKTLKGVSNAFVVKLKTGATALIYSSYLGGSDTDQATAIAVDRVGSIYLTGLTKSADFTTTTGAFQTTLQGNSNAFVAKVAFPATHYLINTPPNSAAGSAFMISVTALDDSNTLVRTYTGTIHFTSDDSQAVLPADYTFTAADQGVHLFTVTLKSSGSRTVTATDKAASTVTGTGTVTITPLAPVSLAVGGFATTTTAGVAGNLTVSARDRYGNIAVSYTGTVHFTSSDTQADLPADYTFTAADQGVHTFSIALKTAGPQSLTAADKGAATFTSTQSGIVVSAAAASSLTAAGFPATTTAGVAGNLTVTLKDPYGNTAVGYRGTVHFSSSDAQARLPANYTFTAADNAVHNFSITLKTAGTRSVTVADIASGTLTSTESGIAVNPAAANSLLLAGLTSPRAAGTAGSVTVTLKDPYGNIAAGYTGAVHFSSSDAQAALPGDYTFSAADKGVHTFSATLKTAGTQSLQVVDKVNARLTATQSGIVVTPAATSIFIVAGFPASITAGVAGMFSVTAKDAYGNLTPAYAGMIHFTSSDPQAALPADAPLTNGTGSFMATLKTTGIQSLTATDTQNSAVKGSQTGIRVNTAPSTLVVAGFPTTITAGTAGTFTVTAKDRFGNTVTTYTGMVHFTSSDPQAAVPDDYGFTATDAGVHTFSATLKTVGTQSLTATDRTLTGITGTQSGIAVNPAAASTLALTGFPFSVVAGLPFNLTITAKDAYGNVATGYTGTVTFSSTDANATLPADYTFTAGDHGVHTFAGAVLRTTGTRFIVANDTANTPIYGVALVHVAAAAADHFLVRTSVDDSGTGAGTPFDVTITAQDAYGNTATDYSGTITFSSQDPFGAMLPADYTFTADDQGTVTFAGGVTLFTAGTWDVTVTDTDSGITGTDNVAVTAAAADHFDLMAPASSVAGQSFDVLVVARDPYGNIDTSYQGTVTFTSTDSAAMLPADYTFTADDTGMHLFAGGATLFTAGNQNLTVTDSDSGLTGTATVLVTPAAADHFQIVAPAQAASGTAFDVTVVALDPYGNVDVNYQGTIHFSSTDPDPGVILPDDYSFSADDQGMHTFAAGVTLITAGDQTLTVMDVDSGITGSAVVTVTDAGLPHPASQATATAAASNVSEANSISDRPQTAPPPERPATAPAAAIDAFFHQMSRHRNRDWWMNAALWP